MGQLASLAEQSLESRGGLQSEIRKICDTNTDDEAGNIIAVEMGVFRSAMEDWINEGENEDEVNDRRKQVNNVINDVSRICRGLIGKSIVCTARSTHTYEATAPKPRASGKSSLVPTPVPRDSVEDVLAAIDDLSIPERKKLFNELSDTSLRIGIMVSMMDTLTEEEFMDTVRNAKNFLDNREL